MKIHICVVCGKEFESSLGYHKTCSKECSKINAKTYVDRKERYIKSEGYDKKHNDFIEINDKAKSLGMSYGEYVAAAYMRQKRGAV